MKRRTKLNLSRETLRHLATPTELRAAGGAITTPATHCATSPFTQCAAASGCLGACTVGVICTA
jgi:hypothetical protein